MDGIAKRDDVSPVILAGGSGTRLWPLSRRTYPKHLIALSGTQTLMQQCADRVLQLARPSRIITVGAADQAGLIGRQLEAVDAGLAEGLILEPAARNTAAACTAAALWAQARFGDDQTLWICAADHVMEDTPALLGAVAIAVEAAAAGHLVTFGIAPAHPEPGFGYIKVGAPLAAVDGALAVQRFVEKPSVEVARAMLDEGGYLWNSGMFVFRVGRFIDELRAHAPDVLAATRAAMAEGGGRPFVPSATYAAIRPAPVDKAVMEVSARVAVVPCDPAWSDVGSWRAVWETLPRDASGNATQGDVVVHGTRDCLVMGRDRLIAAVGVRDLAIIDTGDALMVAARDDSTAVKQVVAELTAAARDEASGYPIAIFAGGERRRRSRADRVEVGELMLEPAREIEICAADDATVHVFGGDLRAPLVVPPGGRATLRNGSAAPQTYVEVNASVRD